MKQSFISEQEKETWSPVGVMGLLPLPRDLAWQSDSCWSGGIGLGRGWKGMAPDSDLGTWASVPHPYCVETCQSFLCFRFAIWMGTRNG